MNNKLFKYSEFLNESKFEMLLEANITYTILFDKVLNSIDSPIAKTLLDLSGKEVDVNTNYIDINRDKDDVVFFKPDDKVAKLVAVNSPGSHYDGVSRKLLGDEYRVPHKEQTGEIIKEYTEEEIKELLNTGNFSWLYEGGGKLVVFMWRDEKGVGKCIFDKRTLISGPDIIKKSEISVGRLTRALLKKAGVSFKDSEIEDFVYKYRTEVAKLGDVFSRFRILEGEDIRKYYHHDKYENEKGTLGSSCMRYQNCQEYFDIYVKNPDQCKLVVLMSDEKEDSICGRALLWNTDGKKVMDRIYTNRTQDEQLFKEFAKKEGFYHKKNQNMLEYEPFISPEGEEVNLYLKIELSVKRYDYFPYMDTMKYFYEGNPSYLSNTSRFGFDFELTDTDGGHSESGCDVCYGEGTVECCECDGRGDFRCQNCDGEGTLECDTCGGMHEMDCDKCDGSGEIDGEECQECSGTGTHTCEECGGENIECGDCDGVGRIECEWCGGDGNVDCPECG